MEKLLTEYMWVLIVLVIWSTPWKGAALWRSARNGHMGWFIVLLVVNTLAILDILYIFFFSEFGSQESQEKPEPEKENIQPEQPKVVPKQNKKLIV